MDDFNDAPEGSQKSHRESLIAPVPKKKLKPLPSIPTLPKAVDEQFSGIRSQEYPPILQTHSWTKSAPYKQELLDLSPGENIGNHFSKVRYRMRDLVLPPKPRSLRIQVDIGPYRAPPPTLDKRLTSELCSYSIMPVEVHTSPSD